MLVLATGLFLAPLWLAVRQRPRMGPPATKTALRLADQAECWQPRPAEVNPLTPHREQSKCPACGARIYSSDDQCMSCGARLDEGRLAGEQNDRRASQPPERQPVTAVKGGRAVHFILLGLAGTAFVLGWLTRSTACFVVLMVILVVGVLVEAVWEAARRLAPQEYPVTPQKLVDAVPSMLGVVAATAFVVALVVSHLRTVCFVVAFLALAGAAILRAVNRAA